jgi:hypothetical protein
MTERDEILKMLRANAGTITENIDEFLLRNAEDLLAVGVDARELTEALLHIGLAHLIKFNGSCGAVDWLRERADALEKIGAKFCQRETRH